MKYYTTHVYLEILRFEPIHDLQFWAHPVCLQLIAELIFNLFLTRIFSDLRSGCGWLQVRG